MARWRGAGQGLGRCHALALAARGARVVVNDLGDETGKSAHVGSSWMRQLP